MTDIAGERRRLAAQGLRILTREQWGAKFDYRNDRAVTWPAHRLFLHIAVVERRTTVAATMRAIESIGISRFPSTGFSYSAAVWTDGTLAEGQPLTRRGAHSVVEYAPNKCGLPDGHNANYDSRALVLPQNVGDDMTAAQVDGAARWAAACIRSGEARSDARWFGHRDIARKDCPTDQPYARIPELQRLTDRYVANGLEDDMDAEQDKMLREVHGWLTVQDGSPVGPRVRAIDGRTAQSNANEARLEQKVAALAEEIAGISSAQLSAEQLDTLVERVAAKLSALQFVAAEPQP